MKAAGTHMDGITDNSVEAARYAVLRRLAPAIRHGIVGQLQPIALISDAMERRLNASQPDIGGMQTGIAQVKSMSRAAMSSCANLVTWLAPEDSAVIPLGEGIDECLKLLGTEMSMRGFELENNARQIDVGVSLSALRNVLTASLLAATDLASAPADLVIATKLTTDEAVLSIAMRCADRTAVSALENGYRRLGWNDVKALAGAESVRFSHQSKSVTLHYRILSR